MQGRHVDVQLMVCTQGAGARLRTGAWPALVAAMVCGLISGCGSPPAASAKRPVPVVTVTPAAAEEITDYDEFVGRTEAAETVEVRSRVNGFVTKVGFQDGQYVKEGDILFEIEPDAYEAILQQSVSRIDLSKARLDLAQKKMARAESLFKSNAITIDEYQEYEAAVSEAQASVKSAEADTVRAKLDVQYTKVTAPIDGRIDRALVTRGNVVSGGLGSGTMLTRIVRNSPIYAYVDVDEQSLLRYQRLMQTHREPDATNQTLGALEMPCYLQLGDEQDFPHAGKLDFAENRVDAETGTIRMRGVFPNSDRLLTGGLFIRMRIPVSQSYTATLIPEEAIGIDQNQKFAYVVESGIARLRMLTVGSQRGSMRVIKEGIRPGEMVISRGLQRVRPDQEVNVSTPTAK